MRIGLKQRKYRVRLPEKYVSGHPARLIVRWVTVALVIGVIVLFLALLASLLFPAVHDLLYFNLMLTGQIVRPRL
jgi:hypothetical protein